MNFSIPDCFMIAFAAGLLFGLVYEGLRIVRMILRFKAVTFACDIAFFLLSTAAVCNLSKPLGNYIRMYTVLGFGAGVFAYIVTVGRLLNIAENAASDAWRRTIGKILRTIGRNGKKCFVGVAQFSKEKLCKTAKYLEIKRKNLPNPLKLQSKKMYNKKRYKNLGESEEGHVIKAKIYRSP